jgi:hypothetical protein
MYVCVYVRKCVCTSPLSKDVCMCTIGLFPSFFLSFGVAQFFGILRKKHKRIFYNEAVEDLCKNRICLKSVFSHWLHAKSWMVWIQMRLLHMMWFPRYELLLSLFFPVQTHLTNC